MDRRTVGYGLIAVGGGALLWSLFSSKKTAQASPVPQLPATQPPQNRPQSAAQTQRHAPRPAPPSPRFPPLGTPAPSDLINRLRSSEEARKIFAIQSTLYAFNFDVMMDGLMGPETRAWFERISRFVGQNVNFDRPGDILSVMMRAIQRMKDNDNPSPGRVIPYLLPEDVIRLVNQTIRQYSAELPLLQAYSIEQGLPLERGLPQNR